MESDSRTAAVDALRRGLDAGLRHVDTAEMYGGGRVETIVAKAIAGRRDRVYLVSKVLPQHATRAGTIRACEASLARLGTDWLDLYLLHWREDVPLAETIAGLEALRDAGTIRAWGVSNFDVDDLEEALAIAGPGRIACNQVLYHLGERTVEHAIVPWCEQHGVAVVGYSPFGSGAFPPKGDVGVLEAIGRARGASARQVALAFLVRRPGLFTIPKSANARRVEENVAAGDLVLDDAELARIDAAFPRGRWRGLPTL